MIMQGPLPSITEQERAEIQTLFGLRRPASAYKKIKKPALSAFYGALPGALVPNAMVKQDIIEQIVAAVCTCYPWLHWLIYLY